MSIGRRRFLRGVTGAAAGFRARGTAWAQSDADARLVVMYEDAGLPIPSDFVGLSLRPGANGGVDAVENPSVTRKPCQALRRERRVQSHAQDPFMGVTLPGLLVSGRAHLQAKS